MDTIFIQRTDIGRWLDRLAEERTVFAPTRRDGAVVYRPYRTGFVLELDAMPTTSPKEIVFPQNETLLTYSRAGNASGGAPKVEARETLPEQKAVIFGARPCGVNGLGVFDQVFDNDKTRDAYYTARRKDTRIITFACDRPRSTCFCTNVGGGPGDAAGSDVMLYPLGDGFVAEAVTTGGKAMLSLATGAPAGDREVAAKALVETAREAMPEPLELARIRENFDKCFNDMEFWEEQSGKCLSCGACAYLCPSCHCFNITDEGTESEGKRLRSWDNCMSYTFTAEASGHNPRAAKAMRLRNRVGHKFVYFPETHEGEVACRGCGRCIVSCPSSVDIRQIAKAIQEYCDDDK
ncbi:4Fe-4S dicluster domain-containing protein [Pseudodesulfovibrio methanolicus]|uniref:4Fe-4S dicluster domain-containing protein n=1 Tax=Pseudodesulfovibrio methanolicus TaxID=3126690 RepID=A0ABZ2J0B2_9BACT